MSQRHMSMCPMGRTVSGWVIIVLGRTTHEVPIFLTSRLKS